MPCVCCQITKKCLSNNRYFYENNEGEISVKCDRHYDLMSELINLPDDDKNPNVIKQKRKLSEALGILEAKKSEP